MCICIYVYMYICMYVCMYVYIYIYAYIYIYMVFVYICIYIYIPTYTCCSTFPWIFQGCRYAVGVYKRAGIHLLHPASMNAALSVSVHRFRGESKSFRGSPATVQASLAWRIGSKVSSADVPAGWQVIPLASRDCHSNLLRHNPCALCALKPCP